MTQLEEVKPVEVVRPQGAQVAVAAPQPVAAHSASNWWIAVIVGFVLVGNAVLVWRRVNGRHPLRRAFRGAAREAGLDRRERSLIEELAGEANPPVTLLISDAALVRAAARIKDDPATSEVLVGIRQKLNSVRA